MSKKNMLLGIAIGVWFIFTSAIIFGMSGAKQQAFDPSLKLSQALMSLTFEQELVNALENVELGISEDISSPGLQRTRAKRLTIYYITQGDCFCEFLARSHQSRLQKWSTNEGFTNIDVDLNSYPVLRHFIPSTPAVLAIDGSGGIVYLGPYSRGAGCFANTGEVDVHLANWANQDTPLTSTYYQNTVIETDASGCYCAS